MTILRRPAATVRGAQDDQEASVSGATAEDCLTSLLMRYAVVIVTSFASALASALIGDLAQGNSRRQRATAGALTRRRARSASELRLERAGMRQPPSRASARGR